MNISYSFGMVDLMHFGHINAIKKASENSDLNIYGLISDEASEAWFGAHVSNQSERRTVLEAIKYIDEVWDQGTFDPLENLRTIHKKYPSAIITLYTGNEWGILSAKKYIESIGGKVIKLDYYDKLSPQAILDTLNKNETKDQKISNNLISTKANTLQALKGILEKGTIEDIYVVTVGEFHSDKNGIVREVKSFFCGEGVVVRSSSKREDAFEESNAGHFTSILNVDSSDSDAIIRAVDTVLTSYGEDIDDEEQVLIQRQTEDVLLSGVVFTRDIQRNRSYYVINYDDSGSTDSVTSGNGQKSTWIFHSATRENIPKKWQSLMDAVWELEDIFSGILLDIEFAVTRDRVVIFQVRPLAAAYKFGRKNDNNAIEGARNTAINKYLGRKEKGLSCFSDMAFWNPAEIIGDNPKNLDYSLYREVITKKAWDDGLVPMGYRSVPKELMLRFGNKPYISLERSFEALIPASVPDGLAKKLCDYYIEKLFADLSSHDKIEFEISHNCYDFSMHNRLLELRNAGFEKEETDELEKALKNLTTKVISSYNKVLKDDEDDLHKLEGARLDIQNITKDATDYRTIARAIHTLLDSINRFGTPQFSRQARCAFIAKSLCRSLVSEGYVTADEMNQFMSGVKTVAVEYDEDYHEVLRKEKSRDGFLLKYGHLRAGTYNIRSPRYDQMNQLFLNDLTSDKYSDIERGDINSIIIGAVDDALKSEELNGLSKDEICEFIIKATEKREYFKFVFTKSLSFSIELIKQLGEMANIPMNDLSYLELPEIYAAEYYSDIDRLNEFWSLIIDKRRELYRVNSEMILPEVICSEKDFDFIENINSRPNFITANKAEGEVVILDEETNEDVDGKIVVIEKADPGYDWIFSKGIIGLITKYGGAASHMAIRCAEFRIPAAIGCGASLYNYATNSHRILIDCKHEKLIKK